MPVDLGMISDLSDEKSGMALEYACKAFCGSEGLSSSRDIPTQVSMTTTQKMCRIKPWRQRERKVSTIAQPLPSRTSGTTLSTKEVKLPVYDAKDGAYDDGARVLAVDLTEPMTGIWLWYWSRLGTLSRSKRHSWGLPKANA